MAPPPPQPHQPPHKKPHILPFLLLILSLLTLFYLSHYFLTPTLPTSPTSPSPLLHSLTSTPKPNFTFTIKLLAYNRLTSLQRCLHSLSLAHYDTNTIHLHIYIDHYGPSPNGSVPSSKGSSKIESLGQKIESLREMLDFVDGFRWDFGEKLVHVRTVNVGLQAQWLEAWWPSSDDEFVFVVEDDLEVSPLYYVFLKRVIGYYYYNQSNFSPYVFGASLQRPRFVPGKHGNKMNLDSETRLFLYPLVGTWGQLLFPRPWKEFRLWYDDHKARNAKPLLDGMVTTGWYKKMGEKIWTPWFIKFIHSRGYFNIYTNFLHERALSVSHRDTGVNYGKTAGPDSQLLDETSVDINLLDMQPLSNLRWYDFCFRQVYPGRAAKKLDHVSSILQTMTKQRPVVVVSLLKTPEKVIRNLICHFEKLNIQNYIFMVSESDQGLFLDLSRRGHPVISIEGVSGSITRSQKLTTKLMKEIVVKAYIIKKCLESGFDSWMIDWNLLLLSDNPLVELIDSEHNFYVGKRSGLFIARSSSSSRKTWDDRFLQNFADLLDSVRSENFVQVLVRISQKQGLKVRTVDDSGFNVELESISVDQSLPVSAKMVSWLPNAEVGSVENRLQELGLWAIDGDSSCKAVVCHTS